MDLHIEGKRVLIDGASQGIGRSIALEFAKEGCIVAVIARRAEQLEILVEEMGGEKSGHSFLAIDLMVEGNPTVASEELSKRGGNFDIAVHCVGGTLDVKDPFSPVEEWQRVWRYNVGIPIEINSVLIPPMRKKNWGRIIHISSISAYSMRGAVPYGAAKSYLNAYVKGLGRAVAAEGIVVSSLMPGAVISENTHWDKIRKTNPEIITDFLNHHQAIGRLGTPEEIAPFSVFMASDLVTFAPGTVIPIDGGSM